MAQGIVPVYLFAVDGGDEIAAHAQAVVPYDHNLARWTQARFVGGGPGLYFLDQQPSLGGQLQLFGQAAGDVHGADFQYWKGDSTSRLKLVQHRFRTADRHGKSDPNTPLSPVDHRIDPDHRPMRIEQRPSTVARINGRIGLDHVVISRRLLTNRSVERAYHSGGQRAVEAERISDRNHLLTDHQLV